MIKRLRVEPISDYLERYRKAKSFPVSVANGFVYVSGLPPFDPQTGEIKPVAFEEQAERVMAQMKHCLEAAGSSLSNVLKCNVYCTPEPSHFATFNAVYDRYFAGRKPGADFRAGAVMAGTVRCRDRLRGGGGRELTRQCPSTSRYCRRFDEVTADLRRERPGGRDADRCENRSRS